MTRPIGISVPHRAIQSNTMTPEQKLSEEVRILTEIVRALSQRVQELETALKESQ
jgi:selenophosphate synthase